MLMQKVLDFFSMADKQQKDCLTVKENVEAEFYIPDSESILNNLYNIIPSEPENETRSGAKIELKQEIESEPRIELNTNMLQPNKALEQEKNLKTESETIELDINISDANYRSNRFIIPNLHLYFIDVVREIINASHIRKVPLMREYGIDTQTLDEIIEKMRVTKILDADYNIAMTISEFEHFLDIYHPELFDTPNIEFDKDIFMCIGEILYDSGVEDVYDCLDSDELLDYLKIMEKLEILYFDSEENTYIFLCNKEKFYRICQSIPNVYASQSFNENNLLKYSIVECDSMKGIGFEKYCAYLLSQCGFINIKITPTSGDHGIDILAEKDEISYAIQCKCYSADVGNSAIQQAHTGKSLYKKDIAVVLTNRYFTAQAREEADTLGVKLWDRDKPNDLIGVLKNK